jgi:hypothetical protein
MKNLAKLFTAVAALFAVSCATDATDDLGVQLGGGQTTVTLSLEESRTQLGEAVDGLYPLTWSADDAISINGVKSSSIAIAENKAVATFTFDGELVPPYSIAYPATEAGKVAFAAEQSHVSNTTFGSNVATMYGYNAEGVGVQLSHLTGVLKFGVTGSATLKKAQISTANGPIAGLFDIDFVSGKVTPSVDGANVINYSFGEGLKLTDEPQYLHVVVPAGEYNLLHVTLYDSEGGVMTANIKADDETPLESGEVRYFATPLIYAPNVADFVIADYDDLVEFASIAATTDKNALVVENIAIPADATWTPIEGFSKVFNGNGYTISGLKAPLFGTTSGTIKNLKVADVAIDMTDTLFAGAIALTLESTAESTAQLINCEASGTITLSYNTVTITANFDATLANIGGLVARAYGAKISKCVNRVNLVGALVSPADIGTQKKYYTPAFGGIVGFTNLPAAGSATTLISHCDNYGSITINDSKANETYSSPAMGGIAGVVNDKTAVLEHCCNHGPLGQNSLSRETDAGGIVGRSYALKVDSCTNQKGGTITFTKIGRYSFFGGICGNSYTVEYLNCTNKATISYQPTSKSSTGYQYMGGILGYTRVTAQTVTNCVNDGKISHTANVYGGTSNCYAFIGGVIGYSYIGGSATGCVNNGEVYVSGIKGNIATADSGTATHFSTGGVFGYVSRDDVAISDCTNNGTINYEVTLYGSGTLSDQYVGGIAGYTKSKILSSTNNGAVNLNTQVQAVTDVTPAYAVYVGGCVGLSAGQLNGCVNKGAVTFAKDAKAYGYGIGGVVGRTGATVVASHNEGPVSVYGDAVETQAAISTNKVGGFAGYVGNTMTGSSNKATGVVTVTGKMFPSGVWPNNSGGVAIGGLAAHKDGATTDCHNYAPVNVTLNLEQGSFTMVGSFYISGLLGYAGNTATDCTNEGTVTVSGDYGLYNSRYGHLLISGCIGRRSSKTYTNVDNKGDIVVNVHYTSTANKHSSDPNHLLVGGVFSGFGGEVAVTGCDNSGDIIIGEGTIVENADVFLCAGGVSATSAASVDLVNCHNTGNITMNGTAKHGAILGGVLARYVSTAVVENCSNSGNILVTTGKEGKSYVKSLYVGGLSGSQSSKAVTVTNFLNSGTITYQGKVTDTCRLGGVVGSQTQSAAAWTGIVNTGNIVFEGTYVESKAFVGGIIGNSSAGIADAQSYCHITNAASAPNVGMIIGTPRTASVVAKNCKLGGRIYTNWIAQDEKYEIINLNSSNYTNYIYGGITDWTDVADYDGCTVLTEKPASPIPAE